MIDLKPSAERGEEEESTSFDRAFIVADPHVVYYDAIMHSPWSQDGGHLPEKDDWSTYRYAVKDIILAVATHRFNKNNRRLEIRGYFVGEHPLFKDLEPTKAMMIVFCCQSYQSGGTLELFFEHGVPYDVRALIEEELNVIVSGHEQRLEEKITRPLFAALSSFSDSIRERILAQDVSLLDRICYNTYRGTWSANQITSLLYSGIPLRWLFKTRPDPLKNTINSSHLMNHLRAVLLEEYALRRLEDRPMGESLGIKIKREDRDETAIYTSEKSVQVMEDGSLVKLTAGQSFAILPIIPRSARAILSCLSSDLSRIRRLPEGVVPVLALPMDFLYLPNDLRFTYQDETSRAGAQVLVVGLTCAQLLSEAETKLAVTAAEIDPDEVDAINVDRYPD